MQFLKNKINITPNAWNKINSILIKSKNKNGMILSATSGGCNGFNYKLNLLDNKELDEIKNKNPNILSHKISDKITNKLYIDPYVEMYLLGTTIDYVYEDFSKNIYENKFVFTPDKNIATSCGCGISFNIKN